jgi:hypothetical protein
MPNMIPGSLLVGAAKKALGTPYVWGGNSLVGGVDCSGLVQQVFAQFGIQLPRVTYEQVGVGAAVKKSKIAVGDLVFFDTDSKKNGPDHVGIYIGNGKFIHAPRPGQPVQIGSLTDSYYGDRLMAIRRIPGVAGAASGVGAIDAATFAGGGEEVRKSRDELAETYGMSTAFFNSVPELKRLLGQAVSQQWDADLFQAHLKNTKWWKVTSSTNRQAEVMAKQDPATYKATLEANRVAVQQMAVKMGAVLSQGATDKLAKNILHFGWDSAQIQNFLGNYIKFNDKHVLGGMAGQAYQQLKTTAYDNGVSLSEQSLKNSAAYITKGVSTMEKETANIRGVAMGAYPAYADQIAAGQNMKDIAEPYVQAMAQTMELPDTDVDLYNPKIKAALNRAGADGKPQPMSITDFVQSLKDTPDWRRTTNAQNSVMAIGHQVLQDMGLAGR